MSGRIILWVLGTCLLFVSIAGCAATRWNPQRTVAHALPLPGGELIITNHGDAASIWVTSRKALELRYQPSDPILPAQVTFFIREAGHRGWSAGPVWSPGAPSAMWSVPREGRFEVVAVPSSLGARPMPPADRKPQSIVTVDWTPPKVEISHGVPAEPLMGGDSIALQWRVNDAFLGHDRPTLELAEGLRGEWRKVADLPPSGFYSWQTPNRRVVSGKLRLTVSDAAGNRATVRVPGVLTVTGKEPFVGGPLHLTSGRRQVELPYKDDGDSIIDRVELWITQDDGESWRLVGYDDDRVSPFAYPDLPEGRWGFQIVIFDREGNGSARPAPGDKPESTLLVDATPPMLEWGAARVLEQPRGTSSAERYRIEVPYRIEDISLVNESVEISFESGGLPIRIPGEYGAEGVVEFERPLGLPEPLVIQIMGNDEAGNGFTESLSLWPSELIEPPRVEFVDLPGGWWPAGQTMMLRYETDWASAMENGVDLDWSSDGKNWKRIATGLPNQGSHEWDTPLENVNDLRVRLTLHGSDGRQREAFNTVPVGVDLDAPTARVVGPARGYGDPVYVHVQGQDPGGSGIDRVELYARAEGVVTWDRVGSLPAADGTIPFRAKKDGKYYFWPVAVDTAGNRSRSATAATPLELFAFVAEEGPPGVRLSSFNSGGVYAGNTRHGIFIDFSGPVPLGGSIRLDYSTDDGTTWRPIGTVAMGAKQYGWQLPPENSTGCRIRAVARGIAGDETQFMSPLPFTIDSTPPSATILSAGRLESGVTRVVYEAEDVGGAKLSQVFLYTSQDDGNTWTEWPEPFPHTGEFTVPLAEGRYSMALRSQDSARNRSTAPRVPTDTQLVQEVGQLERVHVSLISPQGGTYPGGSRHYVFWELETLGVAFPDQPVLLEYRVEGDELWQLIAANQPPSGRFAWHLPGLDGQRVELRVVAQDLHGRFYMDQADSAISIDTSIPEVYFVGPDTSNRRSTEIEFDVSDPQGLEKIELWVRANSTPNWRLIGESGVGEPLRAELADGQYWVALVGVDAAGNRGPTPVTGEKGLNRLLVDTIRPSLRVEGLEERGRLFAEGETVVIRPIVQDHSMSAFPIAVRLSEDNGQTFRDVTSYHPNANDLPIKLPERAGVHYLEVTAHDLAGNPAQQVIPIQVIPTPPKIQLLTDPAGTVHASGTELELTWESRGVSPIHRGMTIEFTVDGKNWRPLVETLQPADGTLRWPLPEVDSNRVRVRFTLTRPDGLTGRAWTGNFTVSTTTPEVEVDPIRPKSPPPK